MTNLDRVLKSRDIILPTKVHLVKAMVFSSSHVWMWEWYHKEPWLLIMDLEGKAIISENYIKPRQRIKKQRHYFANKGPSTQGYGFSSSRVWMWELDHKEGWALKNWCFWTMMLKKTLESNFDCKEIKSVNPKGYQSWIFTGRTDAEAEAQYFGHLMWRTDSLEKILMLGETEGKRRQKRVAEVEIIP